MIPLFLKKTEKKHKTMFFKSLLNNHSCVDEMEQVAAVVQLAIEESLTEKNSDEREMMVN